VKEQLFNYLSTNSGAITLEDILMNFFVASLLSLSIFISYRISHSGAVYSVRFNVSLVMLTLITTLVMNVIGNNIALSLGMVGALSIVRFRTAIKDPRDAAYIFWGIAVGICCGVSEYLIASIGTIVIFIFLMIFGMVKNNERFLLVIRAERKIAEEIERMIDSVYTSKAKMKVKNTTMDSVEYIYELSQHTINKYGKNLNIADELYKLDSVRNVNLVCQNDEINQ
jgi:uncharacterized membrane protein YhiD involved in acid resistance